ncbi:MAG: CrcB family protein, partial [Balneolaceae bacterium]
MQLKAYRNAERWLVWPAIALGGSLGALLRYGWVTNFPVRDASFPWAIFSENVLGAFVLGWLLAIFIRKRGKHRYIRAFFGTGLIGSFTTFSGITLDLAHYVHNSSYLLLSLYTLLSITAGLIAAMAGLRAGRFTLQEYRNKKEKNQEGVSPEKHPSNLPNRRN